MAENESTKRNARLDVRLAEQQKVLIERAAMLAGQTVSSFVVSSLVKSAQDMIREADITELTDRDRDAFLKMLDEPAKPNAALKRAARAYQDRHG